MKEYLKMSKHFNGSVTIDYNGNICDDNSFFGTTDIAEDYYEHICHAINSHDELVAEVERLRKSLEWAVGNLPFENYFEWSDEDNSDAHRDALSLLGVEFE